MLAGEVQPAFDAFVQQRPDRRDLAGRGEGIAGARSGRGGPIHEQAPDKGVGQARIIAGAEAGIERARHEVPRIEPAHPAGNVPVFE